MIVGICLGLPAGAFGVWVASRMDKKLNLSLRESPMVKIADLEDHLSEANAATLKPTLRPRYEHALSQLTATMRRDALEHSWHADDIKRSTLKRLAIQRRG